MNRTQNNLVLHYGCRVRQVFLDLSLLVTGSAVYIDVTGAEGTATQGCDRSADPAAGMAGRRQPPLKRAFWRESDKSQGFGDGVPKLKERASAVSAFR